MEYFYLLSLLGPLSLVVVLFMLRSSRLNNPEHVLQETGDSVRILHTPLARVVPSLGKLINKHKVARIQKADRIVTVFNQSSNAIDITLSKKHTDVMFNRAGSLFPNAEKVVINS